MAECYRVRWMLLLPLAVLLARAYQIVPAASPLMLILYKPALAAVGFLAAHIGYQQAFPYLCQRELLEHARFGDPREQFHATLLFVGTAVMRGLIYAAFILGVTLGL